MESVAARLTFTKRPSVCLSGGAVGVVPRHQVRQQPALVPPHLLLLHVLAAEAAHPTRLRLEVLAGVGGAGQQVGPAAGRGKWGGWGGPPARWETKEDRAEREGGGREGCEGVEFAALCALLRCELLFHAILVISVSLKATAPALWFRRRMQPAYLLSLWGRGVCKRRTRARCGFGSARLPLQICLQGAPTFAPRPATEKEIVPHVAIPPCRVH